MKKLPPPILASLLVVFLSTTTLLSQIKYTTSGNFGINTGTSSPREDLHVKGSSPNIFYECASYGTITQRFLENSGSYIGAYLKYKEYYDKFYLGFHESSDELTSNDKSILEFYCSGSNAGRINFYPRATTNYYKTFVTNAASDGVENYVVARNGYQKFCVTGGGWVYHYGITNMSDSSIKENIKDISNSKDLLLQLRPVSYNLKSDSAIEVGSKKLNYGLIAQEVETIIPNVVNEWSNGLKGINYNELTALMIDALQEQQAEIETLKSQISNLKSQEKKSSSSLDNKDLGYEYAELAQNIPNPFNQTTLIKYVVPGTGSYARINIYDLQGKQIRSYELNERGTGDIEIPAYELYPGIFIYNLIIDNHVIDTKQMILTQ